MKTARLLRIFVGLATMAGLLLSGCAPTAATPTQAPSAQSTAAPSGGTTPEAAPTEYVIGMSFPLTGDLASYGDAAAKAAKMAEEEINASGGINGVPIKVDIQDDRCDGEGGLTVLNKLKAEGVPVVTGFFCSSEVLNVCARYNELQVVQYVDGSNPKIWSGACGDYTFGTWGNDADQGKAQANFALNVLRAKEVGMVYTTNDYGRGLHDSFKAAFEAAGG